MENKNRRINKQIFEGEIFHDVGAVSNFQLFIKKGSSVGFPVINLKYQFK